MLITIFTMYLFKRTSTTTITTDPFSRPRLGTRGHKGFVAVGLCTFWKMVTKQEQKRFAKQNHFKSNKIFQTMFTNKKLLEIKL